MRHGLLSDPEWIDRHVSQDFYELRLRSDGVVWLARRAVVFPSIRALHQGYDAFLKAVDDWQFDRRIKSGQIGSKATTPMGWLLDLRTAPDMRNDPEFEKAVQARRAELLQRSPALAILVGTAAGRLQLSRITRSSASNVQIFDDEDEAVVWVRKRMLEP